MTCFSMPQLIGFGNTCQIFSSLYCANTVDSCHSYLRGGDSDWVENEKLMEEGRKVTSFEGGKVTSFCPLCQLFVFPSKGGTK